ncbi:MAG TPA: aldo/keto reductase [Planctomycetes bacterium]|nr:aldo/keto reductase [Planctomycetota bacterium]
MEYRKLGESGLTVSEIALGSWLTFGSSVDQESTTATVRKAWDLGINFFDTADVYARGDGERALGNALQGFDRKDYVLASKCFFPMSDNPNDRGLSRKHIMESIDQSLRRLQTDYLDLYQCHRFDPETPVLETARAMDDLCKQGKILYWGVSCWTGRQIQELSQLCREHNLTPPISNQPPYSMFNPGIEEEVIPASEKNGLGQVVFSPLAQGVLTGKYQVDQEPPEGSRAKDPERNQFMLKYMGREHLQAAYELAEIARDLEIPPASLALAWCLRKKNVASVIVGATRPEQLVENARASGFQIPPDRLEKIQAILAKLPPVE